MDKETYKNYRKVNKTLKAITACLSVVLIVFSSINLARGNPLPEPDDNTNISTTITEKQSQTEIKTEPTSNSTTNPGTTSTTTTTTTTTEASTEATTTTTAASTTKKYEFADEAEKKGYKNIRFTKTFTDGDKCYFEVRQDSPNKTISRNSLGLVYDTGIDTYALCNMNGNKVCIPIAGGKMPYTAEYYFVKGFIVKSVFEGETYWILVADSNYIYQAGSKSNQTNNSFQW